MLLRGFSLRSFVVYFGSLTLLKRLCLVTLVQVFLALPASAAHVQKEKVHQETWCANAGGITEYTLDDGARVDCLTEEYAIEFDFAPKWAEAIGQALYYSMKTGKRPGIVLIIEHKDAHFQKRLDTVAEKYNIKVWTVNAVSEPDE